MASREFLRRHSKVWALRPKSEAGPSLPNIRMVLVTQVPVEAQNIIILKNFPSALHSCFLLHTREAMAIMIFILPRFNFVCSLLNINGIIWCLLFYMSFYIQRNILEINPRFCMHEYMNKSHCLYIILLMGTGTLTVSRNYK